VNLEYSQIFDARGAMYHRAMGNHPQARKREFLELFARLPLAHGESVLDVPSGGGYLASWLPGAVAVTELELSAGFKPGNRVVETYGKWDVGPFDRVVCLAGLHHIGEQERFVRQLVSLVRPGGVVHLADVDASTPLPRFLDEFVGRYNCTGHSGIYMNVDSFRDLPGTRIRFSEVQPCTWQFASMDKLLEFSADLFGVVDCPRRALGSALEEIGLRDTEAGAELDWRLRYIDIEVL
jgi:SAM-dependent methyltransferase